MRTVVHVPLNFAWALAVASLSLIPAETQAAPPEGTPVPEGEQPTPAAAPSGRKIPRAMAEREIAAHFESPKTRSHVLRVGTEAGIIEAEAPKPAKVPAPAAEPAAVAGLEPGQSVKLGAMHGAAVQEGMDPQAPLPTPKQAAAASGGHVKPNLTGLPAVSVDITAEPAPTAEAATEPAPVATAAEITGHEDGPRGLSIGPVGTLPPPPPLHPEQAAKPKGGGKSK